MNESTLLINLSKVDLSPSIIEFCDNLSLEESTTIISWKNSFKNSKENYILNRNIYERAFSSKLLSQELSWTLFLEDIYPIINKKWDMVICIDNDELTHNLFSAVTAKHKINHRSFLEFVYERNSVHL
jgi:hypothetical protein